MAGRQLRRRDLADLNVRLGDDTHEADLLAENLAPAVAAGLLIQHAPGSPADYSFSHDQIRDHLTAQIQAQRFLVLD